MDLVILQRPNYCLQSMSPRRVTGQTRMLRAAAVVSLALSCSPASAFQLTPSTPPDIVIERQLEALRDDDIGAVYAFASPANKAQSGDVANFSRMVRSGPYRCVTGRHAPGGAGGVRRAQPLTRAAALPRRYLVGHSRSDILLETKIAASRQFLVRVKWTPPSESDDDEAGESSPRSDKVREYWWSLSRSKTGEFAGSYMVDAVIPTQP